MCAVGRRRLLRAMEKTKCWHLKAKLAKGTELRELREEVGRLKHESKTPAVQFEQPGEDVQLCKMEVETRKKDVTRDCSWRELAARVCAD